jgi:hypothetical protein
MPADVPLRRVKVDEHGLEHWASLLAPGDYEQALEALVVANIACIACGYPVPRLVDLVYAEECCGEVWRTIAALSVRGAGDCEDLAALRVADIVTDGIEARIELVEVGRSAEGGRAWHARVRRADGRVEDPARECGMGDSHGCDPLGPFGKACMVKRG